MPKCEIFDPFFYTSKSYMGRWLEDWINFCFFSKTTGDNRHFVFFAHAECALKKGLRRLSLRYKNVYAGWVCANKMPTQAEPALIKTIKTGKKFTHTEPARTICLRVYTTEESASSGRVYIMVSCTAPEGVCLHTETCISPGDVYTIGAWAASRRVYTKETCAASEHVHTTKGCAAPGRAPQRPELHLDLSTLQRPALLLEVFTLQRP